MSEETDFDSTFELLSKVVKAGRAERSLLSPEKLERVVKAYREADHRTQAKKQEHIGEMREGNLQLSNEQIQKLRLTDFEDLLKAQDLKSINGIERDVLESQFEETRKLSDEEAAMEAVKERLERASLDERRRSQRFDKLRKSEKSRTVEGSDRPVTERERKRDR